MADSERRTFSNMLAVLVERGLNFEELQVITDTETHEMIGVTLPPDRLAPNKLAAYNPDVKTDFK